jgi:rod shape-determining protein MreD
MKRIFTVFLLIVVCFLLQTTLFQLLSLAAVAPNLLLILTVAFGYMRGEKEGLYIGFFCGLLVDCIYGDLIVLYALIYMVIGYLNGFVNKHYYSDDIVLPVILMAVSDFIYGFFYYVFEFLLRGRLNFFFYFQRIILPELIYTVILSVVFYKLLHMINLRLEKREEKEV